MSNSLLINFSLPIFLTFTDAMASNMHTYFGEEGDDVDVQGYASFPEQKVFHPVQEPLRREEKEDGEEPLSRCRSRRRLRLPQAQARARHTRFDDAEEAEEVTGPATDVGTTRLWWSFRRPIEADPLEGTCFQINNHSVFSILNVFIISEWGSRYSQILKFFYFR